MSFLLDLPATDPQIKEIIRNSLRAPLAFIKARKDLIYMADIKLQITLYINLNLG